jgi:murein DD-endopeptidase / murein LD-carboxypeptidase
MHGKKINILLLILFIVPLLSFGSRGYGISLDDGAKGFDSTKCSGYHFFKNKGITFDSTSNISLYNELYTWLGVPYVYGGRSKSGTDCSGFAGAIYKAIYSISLPGGAQNIYNVLTPLKKDELKEGDLVFFKINHYSISHVGIYLANNKFIHATSWGKSITISDLSEPYYTRYFFSAARYEKKTEPANGSTSK